MANNQDDPIDFILAQVRSNIVFLEKKGRISSDSARVIAEILGSETPASASNGSATPSHLNTPTSTGSTRVGTNASYFGASTGTRAPPPPSSAASSARAPPPSAAPRAQYVRALYDYNAPGDLNFKGGDMIELTPKDSDNDDWWTGKVNGIIGLFPSNHVERVSNPGPTTRAAPPLPPPTQIPTGPSNWNNEKPPLQSWNSAPSGPPSYNQQYQQGPPGGYQQQPPPPGPYGGYGPGPSGPPQQPQTVIVQGDPNPPKQGRFGKYGGTIAQAAAGGLGFGAGAAIGGDLVNAIF